MSIASQITRIQQDRNTIRTKLVELGLATNTDNLDVLAEAVDNIENKGSVSVNVKEGETYTIPKGYHSGSGTVSGVAGGGNYSLQSKAAVTPTKKQQQITPDDGYYGLSDVTIGAIPDAYQDVTSVTAAAGDVLAGKVIVSSTGTVVTGTMVDNGTVDKTLTTADASYTVPAGKHSGTGTVKIVPEEKSVTPTKSAQNITASTGKVLNKVAVAAIPDEYQVVTEVDATAADVLTGKKIVDATGAVVEGTMADNGTVSKTLTTAAPSMTIAAGKHKGDGVVNIVPEDKTATPTKAAQEITASEGKVLNKVSVDPIPDAYQDVTEVDATAADVLEGKKFVDSEGNVVDGTITKYENTDVADFVFPMGGLGSDALIWDAERRVTHSLADGYYTNCQVSYPSKGMTFTPTKESQAYKEVHTPLHEVRINPIPDEYQVVTGVTATDDKVLTGSVFVDATGAEIEGSMANNGAVTATIEGLTTLSYTIPAGYHNGSGTVSLTSDIEQALAAI